MKAKLFISVITILIFTKLSFGADVTWDGGGADNNWTTTANWSTNALPTTNDRVIFDGAVSNKNCEINSGTRTVAGFWIKSNYTGTISHSATAVTNLVVNSPGFTQDGGTYIGQSGSTNTGYHTVSAPFNLNGGTFTASKNFTYLNDGMTKSGGTFNHNSGTVRFGGNLSNFGVFTINLGGSLDFFHVIFYTSSSYPCEATISSGTTLVVKGNLTFTETSGQKLEVKTGNINLEGDFSITGSGAMTGGGDATVTFIGTATQTLSSTAVVLSSPLPKIVINKSGAGNFVLNGSQIFTTKQTVTLTALGGVMTPNTSTFYFTGTNGQLIDNHSTKDFTFYNLGVTSSTSSDNVTLTLDNNDIVYVTGNVFVAGAGPTYINNGTISFQGTGSTLGVKVTNTNSTGGGNATIDINSSASGVMSVLQGNAAGTGALPNVSVNKNGGQFRVQYIVNIEGALSFNGTTGYSNYACNTDGTNVGIVNLKGNFNIPAGSKINAGTATVTLAGTGSQIITGNSTAGDGKLCNLKIDKSSGTLSLQNQIHLGAAFEYVTGTVSPGTSTVNVYNTGTFDPQITVGGTQMNFNNLSFYGNRTVDGDMTVNGDLTIQTGITLTNTASKIKMGGNFVYATTTANYTNSGTSSLEFINTTAKQINAPASRNIQNLIMNGSGGISFVNIVQVAGNLTLTNGVITSTTTGMLRLLDNATATGGNGTSYVTGPMKKIGNDAFAFPTGKGGQFAPISISAPTLTTDEFQAEFFNVAQSLGTGMDASLDQISNCNYWDLQRTVGTSNVNIGLYWNSTTCYNPEPFDFAAVARWNSSTSKWEEQGLMNVTGNQTSGNVTTFNSISNFGKFVLAKKLRNTYVLLKPVLDNHYYTAYGEKLYLMYEEEYSEVANKKLQYRIYNDMHQRVAEVSATGTATPSASPLVTIVEGKNKLIIDLAALNLSSGYYTLEVINSKNEKQYLRFKI